MDKCHRIDAFGLGGRLRKTAGRGLRHQVGLGFEVLIEPAVGKACERHQVRNPHPVVTTLAKQRGGRLDDVRPVRLCLRLGDLHVQDLSRCAIGEAMNIH
ncbi:hypothetical protein D9M72_494440 [compost metagenome]